MRKQLTVLAIAASVAVSAITALPGAPAAQPTPTVAAVQAVPQPQPQVKQVEPSSSEQWDLPNLDDERVDHWVNVLTTARRKDFAVFLDRMKTYQPMIDDKLQSKNMPSDLIYLAMIESGFNPAARSGASAVGLWQFVADTARRYGLTVNGKVDERKDPEKATDAALAYLADLHDRFGSWYLAAAAYNTGENRVARIMRQLTGSERGPEEAYYAISDHLPKETGEYVPLMIAAARIAKEPAKYGFGDQS